MKSTYTRPYQAESDYTQMRRLLSESYILAGPPAYCTVGDLDWWRCLEDDPQAVQRAQLWFTEEERLVSMPGAAARQPAFIKPPVLRRWTGIMPGRRKEEEMIYDLSHSPCPIYR